MTAENVRALRARMTGRIVVPDDEDWDAARQAWNLAVDQRPAAVALPESADDVIEVVAFARRHSLRVAAQGTGHGAAPLGPLGATILVKTSRMRSVEIDADARVARVEAGVLWMEVVAAASEHGLAALAGSSPDVGVVGYSLGGGVGWLGRKHGLAANSVTAVELVTADGRHIRADRRHHAELFWALRGGGGSFGIVTALELRLYPITEVYAGALFFPVERASEVLHAWREWVADVPDEVTSVGRLMAFPPIPAVPEPLRGNSFALIEAAYLGSADDGAKLIEPLRELGPALDTFATIPVPSLQKLHMDPEQPAPGIADGMMLAELPPEAVDALLEVAGPGSSSPLISVEIRHLGGALAEPRPDHGAMASLDGNFLVFAVGIPVTPEIGAAVSKYVQFVRSALAPWDAGKSYINFTQRQVEAQDFYRDDTYRRLRRIKARYDRGDLFRADHPIPPAHEPRHGRPTRATAGID
jgi:FAD/FMN-containing dehydrogenase